MKKLRNKLKKIKSSALNIQLKKIFIIIIVIGISAVLFFAVKNYYTKPTATNPPALSDGLLREKDVYFLPSKLKENINYTPPYAWNEEDEDFALRFKSPDYEPSEGLGNKSGSSISIRAHEQDKTLTEDSFIMKYTSTKYGFKPTVIAGDSYLISSVNGEDYPDLPNGKDVLIFKNGITYMVSFYSANLETQNKYNLEFENFITSLESK